MKLPVFTVASTVAPAEQIWNLGRHFFPHEDLEIHERGTRIELRNTVGHIEVDVGKGGVWASDSSRLWHFDPQVERKRNLTSGAEAIQWGSELLRKYQLLPDVAPPFRLKPAKATGAVTAYSHNGGSRRTIQEDTTIQVEIEVDVSEYAADQKPLPIVGGGGRFSVSFGDGGRPLAARGVWRPPVGKPELHEVIAPAKAEETYRAMLGSVPIAEVTSELAYYCAPAFSDQLQLYPVYVFSGVATYGRNRVPLRKVMIPATDVGPAPHQSAPQTPRKRDIEPLVRPLPADFMPAPGEPLPLGVAVNRRLMHKKGLKFEDFFLDDQIEGPLVVNPGLKPPMIKELANLLGYYSAGTSWIGLSGGLAGSQNNAQGFVDELGAAGWYIRFNWGDGNAWESDWRRNDDAWVDAVDFAFYTGHANSDGWVLSAPDDTFLHYSETAGPPDLWGANNLEWAVIAACGPLQDEVVGSGGDVLDRWKNAFDGLHILMGYAQVTYDNEEEGRRLAKYAKEGSSIIQSWFRTGQEIQPGGIWVGAYYLGDASGSTGNDHLWGVGSVGPDVTSPSWRACSWVPC